VPQGGLFSDGRVDTLQDQALMPLLNPLEMDGGSIEAEAARLRHAPYLPRFVPLFGASVLHQPRLLLSEALFAGARYQIEDPSFHPYTSKFDYWLEGKTRPTPAELRGCCSTIRRKPIVAAAISTSPAGTACRRCLPTTSSRHLAHRATRTTIQDISTSASAVGFAAI
jgi:hypothetical protein